MVNQTIYDYLKLYSGSFKLEDLKNKILSKGYSEKDFNEAAASLGLIKASSPALIKKKKIRFKLIAISSLVGILLIIIFLNIAASAFFLKDLIDVIKENPGISNLKIQKNKIIISSVLSVLALLISVFYLGFIKTGSQLNSKLMKYSSILIILILIAGLILNIQFIFSIKEIKGGLVVRYLDNPPNPNLYSINSYLGFLRADKINLCISALSIALLIFSISLILSRKQLKFSALAGFFVLITSIALIAFTAIQFINPELKSSLLDIEKQYLKILIISSGLLIGISFLFKTLLLFNSSKRFESDSNLLQ